MQHHNFTQNQIGYFFLSIVSLSVIVLLHGRNDFSTESQPIASWYIAYQLDPTSIEFIQSINFDLAKIIDSNSKVDVDIAIGDSLENVYSDRLKKSNFREITNNLTIDGSTLNDDDRSLLNVTQRIRSLINDSTHSLTIVFVTKGTNRPEIIAEMKKIFAQIKQNKLDRLDLYLIGLDAGNKLTFTSAFEQIKSAIVGSCIDDYNLCHFLLTKAR